MSEPLKIKTPIFDFVAGHRRRKYIGIDEHGNYMGQVRPNTGRGRALSLEAQALGFIPNAFTFWRNIIVLFCVFSVVGHWLECGYCTFMDMGFGIIEEGYPVWDDPMYPYLIYGIATVVITLVVVPLKIYFLKHSKTLIGALLKLFAVTVLLCMLMELSMGMLMNQPDPVTGVYPLWDNSQLPLNVLGQAWLVNDLFLGFAAIIYACVIYPFCLWVISLVPTRIMNVLSVIIVVGFIALCVVKFS